MNALWKQCQTKKSPFKLERVIFSKFLVLSFLLQDPWSLYCPFCCSTMIGLKVLFLRKYFSSCIPLSFRKIYYFWNRHLSMKIVIQKGETFHLISMSFIPWYDDFLSIMQKNQQKSIFWLFKHDLFLNGSKLLYDRVDLFCREFYALSFDTHVFYTLIWRFFEKNAKKLPKIDFSTF